MAAATRPGVSERIAVFAAPGPRSALRRARSSRSFAARSSRSCFWRSFSAFFASFASALLSPAGPPSSPDPFASIGGAGFFFFLSPPLGVSAVCSSTKSSRSLPAGFAAPDGVAGSSTEKTSSIAGALDSGRADFGEPIFGAPLDFSAGAPRSRLEKGSPSSAGRSPGGGIGSSRPGSGTAPWFGRGGALEGGGGRKSTAVRSAPSSRPGSGTAPGVAPACRDGRAAVCPPSPPSSSPGSGTAPAARGRGAAATAPSLPGSGTAPPTCFATAPGGRPDGGAFFAGFAPGWPGSGTGLWGTDFAASPGLGRCTVKAFLHFGHLIDSPAGGTRESSSS